MLDQDGPYLGEKDEVQTRGLKYIVHNGLKTIQNTRFLSSGKGASIGHSVYLTYATPFCRIFLENQKIKMLDYF